MPSLGEDGSAAEWRALVRAGVPTFRAWAERDRTAPPPPVIPLQVPRERMVEVL